MNHTELLAAFKRDKVDASSLSARQQTHMALRFARLYERHGLIKRGKAPPLWDCCPDAGDCWREALEARPFEGPEDGGISLPWIGPEYRPGGEDYRFPDEWITAFADRPAAETHIAKWWSSARPAQVHAGAIAVLVATKSGKIMGAFQVAADPVDDGSHPTTPAKWPWTVLLRPLVLLDGTVAPRLRDFQLTAPHRYKAVKDPSRAAALLDAIHPALRRR